MKSSFSATFRGKHGFSLPSLALLICAIAATTGCQSVMQKAVARHTDSYTNRLTQLTDNYNTLTNILKTQIKGIGAERHLNSDQSALLLKQARVRLTELLEIKQQKLAVEERMNVAFDALNSKADVTGRVKFSLGLSGVMAGIAAAALTVASPANAVWVTVCSGWAGGIAGINTLGAESGLSRDQVAQLLAGQLQMLKDAYSKLKIYELESLVYDDPAKSDDWDKDLQSTEDALNTMQIILYSLRVPTLPTGK